MAGSGTSVGGGGGGHSLSVSGLQGGVGVTTGGTMTPGGPHGGTKGGVQSDGVGG